MKAVIVDRYGREVQPLNRLEAFLLPCGAWIDRHPTAALVGIFVCVCLSGAF